MNGYPVFKHTTLAEISQTGNPWVYLYYWLPYKDWVIGPNYLESAAWAYTDNDYIPGTFLLLNDDFVVFPETK